MGAVANFINTDIRMMMPILIAALGLVYGERAGVLNIGGEGIMLVGAFAGYAGAVFSGSVWWGLLIAGAAGGIILGKEPIALITLMAVLFVICIFMFFQLYQIMYMHSSAEPDYILKFASRYELSQRETELMRLILGSNTNKEIAEHLFISENTVKFHVRNLLRKTDCKNRSELLSLYDSFRSPQ